jgi:hypothetical protein
MELTSLAKFCSIGTSPERKALVHFFLCILGTLPSLNFPENGFFLKTCQSSGAFRASGSYCPAWRIASRGQNFLFFLF